jgi:hypothetical protein
MIYMSVSLACWSDCVLTLFGRRNRQLARWPGRPLEVVRHHPRSERMLGFEPS